jgi:hypothetical protein
MIRKCSWCGKVNSGAGWAVSAETEMTIVTHGICDPCRLSYFAEYCGLPKGSFFLGNNKHRILEVEPWACSTAPLKAEAFLAGPPA